MPPRPTPQTIHNVNQHTLKTGGVPTLSMQVIALRAFDSLSYAEVYVYDWKDKRVATYTLNECAGSAYVFELRDQWFTADGTETGGVLNAPQYHYIAVVEDRAGYCVMQTEIIDNYINISYVYDMKDIFTEISDLDELIKSLRKKNLSYEFVIATEANTTRNVEVGDLDSIIYKTKIDADNDWSIPTSTGTIYVWYNKTGEDKEIIYMKEADT